MQKFNLFIRHKTPNKKIDWGRSMIEMLGVLSLIGILSIGALSGYNYAMDKYKANTTINDLNLRAVDIIIQYNRKAQLTLNEWGNRSTLGYVFSQPQYTEDGFVLGIQQVPSNVCQKILGMVPKNVTEIQINGAGATKALCQSDEKITLNFFYVEDENGNISSDDHPGQNPEETSSTSTSLPEETEPIDPDACLYYNGLCYPCSYPGDIPDVQDDCEQVCPNRTVVEGWHCFPKCSKEYPLRIGTDSQCHSCYTSEAIYDESGTCLTKCPNRIKHGDYCILPDPCPHDNPLKSTYGTCYACDYLNPIYMLSSDITQCEAFCPNRQPGAGDTCILKNCPTGYILDSNGSCLECNSARSNIIPYAESTQTCEEACPGSRITQNGKCVLTCSDPTPLKSTSGVCYPCDSSAKITATSSECAKCANRKIKNGYCVASQLCSEEKPLADSYGRCYACTDETAGVYNPQNCLQACPDSRHIGGYMNAYCVINTCPADKPLRHKDNGSCYSCNDASFTHASNCTVCPNRIEVNGVCRIQCSANQPLMDWNGNCYSCDTPQNIYVGSTNNCAMCSNRHKIIDYCVLGSGPDETGFETNTGFEEGTGWEQKPESTSTTAQTTTTTVPATTSR